MNALIIMRITYGLCLDNRNIHHIISWNPTISIKQKTNCGKLCRGGN